MAAQGCLSEARVRRRRRLACSTCRARPRGVISMGMGTSCSRGGAGGRPCSSSQADAGRALLGCPSTRLAAQPCHLRPATGTNIEAPWYCKHVVSPGRLTSTSPGSLPPMLVPVSRRWSATGGPVVSPVLLPAVSMRSRVGVPVPSPPPLAAPSARPRGMPDGPPPTAWMSVSEPSDASACRPLAASALTASAACSRPSAATASRKSASAPGPSAGVASSASAPLPPAPVTSPGGAEDTTARRLGRGTSLGPPPTGEAVAAGEEEAVGEGGGSRRPFTLNCGVSARSRCRLRSDQLPDEASGSGSCLDRGEGGRHRPSNFSDNPKHELAQAEGERRRLHAEFLVGRRVCSPCPSYPATIMHGSIICLPWVSALTDSMQEGTGTSLLHKGKHGVANAQRSSCTVTEPASRPRLPARAPRRRLQTRVRSLCPLSWVPAWPAWRWCPAPICPSDHGRWGRNTMDN